jgi:hypothetical protein
MDVSVVRGRVGAQGPGSCDWWRLEEMVFGRTDPAMHTGYLAQHHVRATVLGHALDERCHSGFGDHVPYAMKMPHEKTEKCQLSHGHAAKHTAN